MKDLLEQFKENEERGIASKAEAEMDLGYTSEEIAHGRDIPLPPPRRRRQRFGQDDIILPEPVEVW